MRPLFIWCLLALAPVSEVIEVSIVNVDVFVTDRSGRRVRGLTKDDFEIFEDGKRQPITNFAEYGGSPPAPASSVVSAAVPPPAPTAARAKRTIVVFVDRFSLPQFRSAPMFAALRAFLRSIVERGDAVTIVSWRNQAVTRVPFTDDLQTIERTLDKIERESAFIAGDDQSQINAERDFEQEIAGFAAAHQVTVEESEGPTVSGYESAMRARFEMRRKVYALNALIDGISAAEGTKALVMVTHRFSRIAGKEYLAGINGAFGPKTDAERDNDMSAEIERVIRSANANSVRIYALYPEGMGSVGLGSAEQRDEAPSKVFDAIVLDNEIDALQEVSGKTGGNLAWGSQDIIRTLPSIQEDFDSYYSLAYRARPGGTDRAHKIVVRAKDRALAVRARAEYVEKSETTRMKERVVANLFGTDAGGLIPVKISLGPEKRLANGRRMFAVTVSFPAASLSTTTGAFSVYVGSGNASGSVGEVTHQTRSFERSKVVTFTYEFDLLTDAKTTTLSVGVIDEVGKDYGLARATLGSTGVDLHDVPKSQLPDSRLDLL